MSETPISPLRRRMLEDMTVRKLGPRPLAGRRDGGGPAPFPGAPERSGRPAERSAMNNTVTAGKHR
jgi:hypothetical protein